MITRFVSLAIIAVSVLLTGCMATMGGAATHRGPHHAVTIAGAGTNVVPQPVVYAGQPKVIRRNPFPAEECPSGYRQFNGVTRCMDDYAGKPWQSWVGPQGYAYSHRPTVRYAAECDFTDDGIQVYVEHQSTCDRLAAKMARKVEGRRVSAPSTEKPAYCPITKNGVTKNVINHERRNEYCNELTRDLSTGKISWDSLEVVKN